MPDQGYDVYKVQEHLGVQDPMMGDATRYHTVIFVETNADKGGRVFHMTGDLVIGMIYEQKTVNKPEESEIFHAKTCLGRVRGEDLERMDQVLRALPAPHRQRAFNHKTMRTEQIKPDGSFYGPEEQKPPFIKCTEWIEHRAIPALHSAQLLHNNLQQAPLHEHRSDCGMNGRRTRFQALCLLIMRIVLSESEYSQVLAICLV